MAKVRISAVSFKSATPATFLALMVRLSPADVREAPTLYGWSSGSLVRHMYRGGHRLARAAEISKAN